jgi:hypothetical protein
MKSRKNKVVKSKEIIAKEGSLEKWTGICNSFENIDAALDQDCGYCVIYNDENCNKVCGGCPLQKAEACFDDGNTRRGKRSNYWRFIKYIREAQYNAEEIKRVIAEDLYMETH